MNQLIQIIISILYGFIYGIIFKFISKKLMLTTIITAILTVSYIVIMYFLNFGIINYILKISIIIGFIFYTKVSKLKKKM